MHRYKDNLIIVTMAVSGRCSHGDRIKKQSFFRNLCVDVDAVVNADLLGPIDVVWNAEGEDLFTDPSSPSCIVKCDLHEGPHSEFSLILVPRVWLSCVSTFDHEHVWLPCPFMTPDALVLEDGLNLHPTHVITFKSKFWVVHIDAGVMSKTLVLSADLVLIIIKIDANIVTVFHTIVELEVRKLASGEWDDFEEAVRGGGQPLVHPFVEILRGVEVHKVIKSSTLHWSPCPRMTASRMTSCNLIKDSGKGRRPSSWKHRSVHLHLDHLERTSRWMTCTIGTPRKY